VDRKRWKDERAEPDQLTVSEASITERDCIFYSS
jgi:hypothetical protein